jgi:hypothetical protein
VFVNSCTPGYIDTDITKGDEILLPLMLLLACSPTLRMVWSQMVNLFSHQRYSIRGRVENWKRTLDLRFFFFGQTKFHTPPNSSQMRCFRFLVPGMQVWGQLTPPRRARLPLWLAFLAPFHPMRRAACPLSLGEAAGGTTEATPSEARWTATVAPGIRPF